MKRAVFVAFGTIAGLTATLRYTPDNPLLTAGTDLALGGSQSLGGTQSQAPATNLSPTVRPVAASKTPAAGTTSKASPQQVVPAKTTKPNPTKTAVTKPTAKPHKTVKPKPKKTVKPKPKKTVKPTPTNTAQSSTFTGTGAAAGFYGTVQVRIQVSNGRMTSITPLSWPVGGTSSAISQYAIPLLMSDALNAQSANVSTISGASYTSQAFRTTLASAMSQAGL